MQKNLEVHPVANIFPAMEPDDLKALAADIKKHGQRDPILLKDGKILDGRSRYAACKIAGVEPITRFWGGTESTSPTDFVLSLNFHRRHLTVSQRAGIMASAMTHYEMEAKERQRLGRGQGVKVSQLCDTLKGTAAEIAAKVAGVSPRTMVTAKEILTTDPKLIEEVKAGKITIHAAKRRLTNAEQYARHEKLGAIKPQQAKFDEAKEKYKPFMDIARRASDLAAEMDSLLETAKRDAPCLSTADVVSTLKRAVSTIRLNQPYAVCPYCQGDGTDNACRGTGWAYKTMFDSAPRELKVGLK